MASVPAATAGPQIPTPVFAARHVEAPRLATGPVRRDADGDPVVLVETPLGSFEIELLESAAPATVANFLKYVTDGDFVDSFIHRSVPGFIVQGGGFTFTSVGVQDVPADPPVINEFNRSNLRGTVAMAKLGNDPNSATNQWFVNLADNSANLDSQNGGFTVFGQVLANGMAVVDAIAATPTFNAGTPFDEIPLINYTPPNTILEENVIKTNVVFESAAGVGPPILMRRTTDRRWFSHRLAFDNTSATTDEEGFVSLTRNGAFETVSRADFDGDGEADVMLRATRGGKKGRWSVATLSGATITSKGSVEMTRDTDFQIVSSGDFDGDGKADLLLRNVVDGTWLIYLLDTKTITGTSLLELSTDLTDTLAGTGDFNGDGRSDILLRRADGTWLMYTFDGLTAPIVSTPNLTKQRKFVLQSVADFNGDGRADVLLRHEKNGRWLMYILSGPAVIQKGAPAMLRDKDFTLQSDADFNNDGTADALLRSTDGSWFLYSLIGLAVSSEGSIDMTTDTAFEIVSIDDFNGDGKADALLRHDKGRWLLYGIDGNSPAALGSAVPPIDKSTTWVPQLD